MSVLIRLESICKTYPRYSSNLDRVKELLHPLRKVYHEDVDVIKDVTFEINRNEVVGIIGKNGAGKSTLLKIISGVVSPTQGDVVVNGTISALIELGSGFNPEFTGKENVYFYCMTQGMSKLDIDSIYDDIINFADIGDYINQPVKTYSSGMFARLAFSASVNVKPDILIVDEILSVGDVFFQQKCIMKMKQLIKEGSSVIFVSHDMHAVKFFCDRLIFIEEGRVIRDGYNTTEILDFYQGGKLCEEDNVSESNQGDFVKIIKTDFHDISGVRRNRFKVGESISVEITFEVNVEEEGRFLGFGMRNSDGVYVFGVNTKLDGMNLPSEKGTHKVKLDLKKVNLYKSVYDCWSVIYNDTGTVALSAYNMKAAIEIYKSFESCEGVVELERVWYTP